MPPTTVDLLNSLTTFRERLLSFLPWPAVIEVHLGQTYFTLRVLWKKNGAIGEDRRRIAWEELSQLPDQANYLRDVITQFNNSYARFN